MAHRVAWRFSAAQGGKPYRGDDFEITSEITHQERIDPFRDAAKKAAKYGGKAKDWRKMKGVANVRYDDGETESGVEVHWVEAHGIGRFEFKVKEE